MILYLANKGLFFEMCEIRNSIWSARIVLPRRIKYSTLEGLNGTATSIILASSGVLPPLRLLHLLQAVATFVQTSFPPSERGIIWSLDKCLCVNLSPQYRHYIKLYIFYFSDKIRYSISVKIYAIFRKKMYSNCVNISRAR